jgi:DNA-binding transcriptional MocR family regulator
MAKRYNGSNNGRISYSVREVAAALHVSKGSVKSWLDVLHERGFIVCTRRGAFSLKATRDASEWRLTEYDCDTPAQHATKDFMHWSPPEPEENTAPTSKTRFSQRTRTVQPQVPYGSATATVKSKRPKRFSHRYREAPK